MSKGDWRRPVNKDKYDEGYEAIFGRKEPKLWDPSEDTGPCETDLGDTGSTGDDVEPAGGEGEGDPAKGSPFGRPKTEGGPDGHKASD